jgi:hypothetical protein
VAGLLLVGVLEMRDQSFDHAQVATMFAIGLVILVLVMANLRRPSIPNGLWWLILGLTVGDVVVAYAA